MKIITIIGARPQFVKAAVVSDALAKKDNIKEIVVHTGQHFDANMSDIFFEQLSMKKPKYNLDINGGSHADMTAKMMVGIEKILIDEKADALMVYGDTNSTLAGALAASKIHVPVIHVEAGLRSFDMQMPEEVNRILTDRISNVVFCPTDVAVQNLKEEGFEGADIKIVKNGDVMQDTAMRMCQFAQRPEMLSDDIDQFMVCTFHRPSNTDEYNNLEQIVMALNELHEKVMPIVLPLHPRTKSALEKSGMQLNVCTIDPVGYLEMLWLLDNSSLVLTDSGGLQKEAYFFEKPCVTMRDQTEWVELIDVGANVLTGANKDKIIDAVRDMMGKMIDDGKQLYGGGHASEKIANVLEEFFIKNI